MVTASVRTLRVEARGGSRERAAQPPLALRLSPRRATAILCAIVAFLFVCSVAGQVGRFYFHSPTMLGFVPLFYLDNENSVPTWYQSLALLSGAGLLALTAATERRARTGWAPYWAALAIIFLGLSLDEVASIHERTIEPLKRLLGGTDGIWAPTWVIPGLAFVVGLALAYGRFLLALPAVERRWLVTSAAVFLAGAIGVEMATGSLLASGDLTKEMALYVALAHLEELLEMSGVLILLHALLRRLASQASLTVTIVDRKVRAE